MIYLTVISFSDNQWYKMLRFFNASWLRELRRAATELHDRREELLPDGFTFAEEGTDSSSAWGWIAFPLSLLLVMLLWWRFYPHQLRYNLLCVHSCHFIISLCVLCYWFVLF